MTDSGNIIHAHALDAPSRDRRSRVRQHIARAFHSMHTRVRSYSWGSVGLPQGVCRRLPAASRNWALADRVSSRSEYLTQIRGCTARGGDRTRQRRTRLYWCCLKRVPIRARAIMASWSRPKRRQMDTRRRPGVEPCWSGVLYSYSAALIMQQRVLGRSGAKTEVCAMCPRWPFSSKRIASGWVGRE